ncbi:hypothetical protein PV723_17470 [Streptomyces sp. AK04-3B]|nr:hypothetical protein [Streptomyces sp. AK04-3B]MDX3800512.1 hypothetical protein [Streptomyces sp. AK04-3B]
MFGVPLHSRLLPKGQTASVPRSGVAVLSRYAPRIGHRVAPGGPQAHGGATRSVDGLVKALGSDAGVSKCGASRICGDLDGRLAVVIVTRLTSLTGHAARTGSASSSPTSASACLVAAIGNVHI